MTDAGDNETTSYQTVRRRMRHPRTGERLEGMRVVDDYPASARRWTMAEAWWGSGPVGRTWARRMPKVLTKPNGIRRVLNAAAAVRSRQALKGQRQEVFRQACPYLRERTRAMRYAANQRVGIPCGRGVTEAACKTIDTQRLTLSGMRWQQADSPTLLNLRGVLPRGVWTEAYQRVLNACDIVPVPTYDPPEQKMLEPAA